MPGGRTPESRLKLACLSCEVQWYGYKSSDKCWVCGEKADAYNLQPAMRGFHTNNASPYDNQDRQEYPWMENE